MPVLRTLPATDSVLNQIKFLNEGSHINLNIIQVGIDQYQDPEFKIIEQAIRIMRQIYAQVNIALGRIDYWQFTSSERPGLVYISDDCEATDLTNSWTAPNDGLDVFVVLTYAGTTLGRSETDGPCDKDKPYPGGMSGSVIAIDDAGIAAVGGQVFAHEVGHYLGLKHVVDDAALLDCLLHEPPPPPLDCLDMQPPEFIARLMFPRTKGGSNIAMTSGEGDKMREKDCFVFRCKP